MILIDLRKAFDTIDHTILLERLGCLGFPESAIKWHQSYLANRTFSVNVDKEVSEAVTLTCGVSQGSILGPLILCMYVNDMLQAVDCDLILYAGDFVLFSQGKNIASVEENLNRNFNSLCNWFLENK